jgi:hypothetical protein
MTTNGSGGSDISGGPDWWQASDGKWYPPPMPGSDDPTTAMSSPATEAMPAYLAPQPDPAEPAPEREPSGMTNATKGLLIGGAIVIVGLVLLLILSAQKGNEPAPTTTVAPATTAAPATTTPPRRPATTLRPPTTEAPPTTTEAPPSTTEVPTEPTTSTP